MPLQHFSPLLLSHHSFPFTKPDLSFSLETGTSVVLKSILWNLALLPPVAAGLFLYSSLQQKSLNIVFALSKSFYFFFWGSFSLRPFKSRNFSYHHSETVIISLVNGSYMAILLDLFAGYETDDHSFLFTVFTDFQGTNISSYFSGPLISGSFAHPLLPS